MYLFFVCCVLLFGFSVCFFLCAFHSGCSLFERVRESKNTHKHILLSRWMNCNVLHIHYGHHNSAIRVSTGTTALHKTKRERKKQKGSGKKKYFCDLYCTYRQFFNHGNVIFLSISLSLALALAHCLFLSHILLPLHANAQHRTQFGYAIFFFFFLFVFHCFYHAYR